ncbi:amidohydrolase family protein [Prosthecobacter sp.]|uniref:amidohydrolase family protein n=1 Tax=Prosthecobacter sp. TaxID=1965333 RepID=UPI001D8928C0|nr:amidohydrolase family protein [Prosthecobacter sp.]MCB1275420.1 amidohydrolase family protein [Prosthecobacter sp.]
MNRRQFLQTTSAAALTSCSTLSAPDSLIIDTHQHLWDSHVMNPPWLKGAPEVLRHDYVTADYLKATAGLNVKAIYMEVDVAPGDHIKEADGIVAQCRAKNTPTIAATIGGRPASADFESYVKRYAGNGIVKGLRQVLHGDSTPAGFCLGNDFVRGIQTLGKHGLNFELTMRPMELEDGAKLIKQCPDTPFVLDHCGNGDPKAFNSKLGPGLKRTCTIDGWKRGIDAVAAARADVMCKISGIVAFVPPGKWHAENLAPVVNHCLDAFGPDRVFFGGDWPVCLLGSPVRGWVDALKQIVSSRPASEQRKLWSSNAIRFYKLRV